MNQISIVVNKYDNALQQISQLKRENNKLQTIIRSNDQKALKLIDHYKREIDQQTRLASSLKDEIRQRDHQEILNRQRNYRDQATWIEEQELQSKENELLSIIYMLEDEITSLKDDKVKQQQDFERQTLLNQENVKRSFQRDIDTFRSQISNDVCEEVREVLTDTCSYNDRLTTQFKLLLNEMEQLQVSRDEKAHELTKARRQVSLLMQKNKLMGCRIHEQIRREQERVRKLSNKSEQSYPDDEVDIDEIVQDSRKNRKTSTSTLEDYFKQAIRDAQQTSKRMSL